MENKLRLLGLSKNKLIAYIVGTIIAALLPLMIKGSYSQHVLCMILIWAIVGMGWNFIGGYAGQVSIGHSVFYAIGAYTVAVAFKYFRLTPWISIWIAAIISVIVAFLFGMPLLRLKGHYFAVATMAVAESMRVIFVNWQWIGGATGIDFLNKKVNPWLSIQFPEKIQYYYLFLIFAIAILVLVILLDRSRFGYYLRTIKGNEQAAESVGIDTTKYKSLAFMLSAAIVSIGGSLYAQYMLYIDPPMLMQLRISLMICLVCVMGGIGTILGPLIGAVIMTVVSEYTRVAIGGSGKGIDQILYGVIVIVIVLFLPDGILSLFRRKRAKNTAYHDSPHLDDNNQPPKLEALG